MRENRMQAFFNRRKARCGWEVITELSEHGSISLSPISLTLAEYTILPANEHTRN